MLSESEFSGSHAPAWEPIFLVPTRRRGNRFGLPPRPVFGLWPLCSHLDNAFPRRRVGTRTQFSSIGSIGSIGFLVPTRWRGNRFGLPPRPVFGLWPLCSHLDNAFPRRRVGTRNLISPECSCKVRLALRNLFSGSHAPAWEPIWFAPAFRLCGLVAALQSPNAFPRRRVGTRTNAGAWEREQIL